MKDGQFSSFPGETRATVDGRPPRLPWLRIAVSGALAGLAGGVAFGVLMWLNGMLTAVGMLIRQPTLLAGVLVHMAISALFGILYGVIVSQTPGGRVNESILGIVYGLFWWAVGGLILMPMLLGQSQMILMIGPIQWISFAGHLLYGLITAIVLNLERAHRS